MAEVLDMKCPGCNNRIGLRDTECEYCGAPIVVKTSNLGKMGLADVTKYANSYKEVAASHPESKIANAQVGMCYVRLKLYDKAFPFLEKAIDDNMEDPDAYCMAAICLLKGKKPFVAPRADIDKIMEYLNAALMIAPESGIYYYLRSYIKKDYFDRKYLNVSPSSEDDYVSAIQYGTTEADITSLNELLGIQP